MTSDSTRNRLSAVFFAFIMVTSMVAMSAAFAGTAAANTETTNPGAVTQGASSQPVSLITIDEADGGNFGASGTASVSTASGVTIDEANTDIGYSTTSGQLTNVRVADQSTIRFDYSGFNTSADTRINISGVAVNVGASVSGADLSASVGTDQQDVGVTLETATLSSNETADVSPGGSSNVINLTVTDGAANAEAIQNGSTVEIAIPDSNPGLTFNQSQSLNPTEINNTSVSGAEYLDDRTVAIDVAETDGGPDADRINVSVKIDAAQDAASVSGLNLSLISTPQDGSTAVTSQSSTGDINVTAPTLTSNKDTDATLDNDGDGETGVTLSDNQINITSGANNDISDSNGKNVTITIPSDAAFTFDQNNLPEISSADDDISGGNDAAYVDDRTINVTLNGSASQGDNVSIDSFAFNLTAGAQSNTRLQFAVNESGPIGVSQNYINVTQVAGSTVQGNATGGTTFIDNPNTTRQIGSTVTSRVNVSNASAGGLGGEDVSLSVTDQPSGASASLNTSTIQTNASGVAAFNVTLGDIGGTYNVTASTAANPDNNVTFQYTATSGSITQFNVTGQENALIDTTDLSTAPDQATSQGVYQVRLEDANGNLNDTAGDGTEVNFRLSLGDNAAGIQNVTTAIDTDGTAAGNATAENSGVYTYNYTEDTDGPGVFYVFVNDPTPGDTDLTVQEGGTSDTGTTTFFDTVDSVDVSLNNSTAAVDSDVEVSATPVTSDGTTITVANLSTTTTVNNTTVASPETQDIETAADGTATATITADQNGTTFVNATISGVTGSTELTVGGQADTGSPLDGMAGEYDADGDGEITISELANAGSAYTDGELTISELAEVGAAYTSSN